LLSTGVKENLFKGGSAMLDKSVCKDGMPWGQTQTPQISYFFAAKAYRYSPAYRNSNSGFFPATSLCSVDEPLRALTA